MRRLARWTLNALTALSLLLCVASAILLAIGPWWTYHWESVHLHPSDRSIGDVAVTIGPRGRVVVGHLRETCGSGALYGVETAALEAKVTLAAALDGQWRRTGYHPNPADDDAAAIGFAGVHYDRVPTARFRAAGSGGAVDQWWVSVPLWPPLAAFALAPTVVAVRRGRRRSRPAGLCPGCGYDLRATPAKCPECGRAAAADAPAAGAV